MPQERRLVTVVFADIVNSSASIAANDPEVVREALGETFSAAREIFESHGGTVEKFIGDAVMAVFGLPVTHEDDAERAVRAALALRAGASTTPDPLGFTFRIGINSGEVVAGDGQGEEFLVTGQPVHLAARLQQLAIPGEVLAGQLTIELTQRSVKYGDARTVFAKGIGMVETRPVLGAPARGPREPRTATFVGRGAELGLLAGFLARATTSGRAHLVTVTGDAGVGKSRLVHEFVRRSGSRAIRTACLPYGPAITYWPLQELVRDDANISASDDLATARAKIGSAVAASVDADPAEADLIARQLSTFAVSGTGRPDGGAALEQPHDLARALRRYLEGRMRASPGIVVIEDLHWADDALLEILDDLLSQMAAPVLIVTTARRELLDRDVSWGASRANALTIDLEPLSDPESVALAGALLGDPRDQRIAAVVKRTEGNPLFGEEYVGALADRGLDEIPATLHGVIAARLDAASATLRRSLQEASVLGREFWVDALPRPDDPTHSGWVDEGLHRSLVVRSSQTGPSGTRTYRFKHGLIRDVAYASLAKSDRSQLHDHYADWLTATPGERAHDYTEIALYHSERAFELAREVRVAKATELGLKAFRALRRAVTLATARADYQLTLELCRRALAVAGLVGYEGRERVDVQSMAAIARIRIESSAEAVAELDSAIDAARSLGASVELVYLLTWRAWTRVMLDEIVVARALYAEAVNVARRTGDADAIAYALWTSAEPLRMIGRIQEHIRALEEALAHMRGSGSDRWVPRALVQLSASALDMDDVASARAHAEEALAIAERTGRRVDRYLALDALARALVAARDPRGREVAERALVAATELGGPAPLARTADVVAEAEELDGDTEAAETLVVDILGRLDPDRTPTLRVDIARLEAIHARLALARDDPDAATKAVARAVRLAPRSDVACRARVLIAAATVARAAGNEDEAGLRAAEARDLLAPTDHRALLAAAERLLTPVARSA